MRKSKLTLRERADNYFYGSQPMIPAFAMDWIVWAWLAGYRAARRDRRKENKT